MPGQATGNTRVKATADFMKKCDLPKNEAVVYLTLLGIGQTSSGELSLYSGFSLKKTEDLLGVLEQKGLVTRVGDRVDTYFARPPYEGFAQSLSDFAQTLKTFEEDISTKSKTSKSALTKTDKAGKKAITERITEFQHAIKDIWEQFNKETGDQVETGLQTVTEKKETAIDAVEQQLTTFGEDSGSVVQALKSNLSEGTETLATQLQEVLEKTSAHSEGNLTSLSETTSTSLKSHAESFESGVSAFGQNVAATIKNMKATCDQREREYAAALEEMTSTEITRHKEVMEALKRDIGVFSEEEQTTITNVLETTQTSILSPLDETTESTLKILDVFLKNQESMPEKALDRLRQLIEDLRTSLKQELETVQVEASNTVAAVRSDVTTTLKDESNGFTETLAGILKGFEEKLIPLVENTKSKVQQAQENVSQTNEQAKEDVDTFQTTSSTQFETFISTFNEEVSEVQKELQTSAGEVIDRHVAEIQTSYDTVSSEFSKTIATTTSTTQDHMHDFKTKAGELIEADLSTFEQAVDKLQADFVEKLDEQKSTLSSDTKTLNQEVSGRLANFLNIIETNVNEIQNDLSTLVTSHASKFTENTDNLLQSLNAMIKERQEAFQTNLAHTRSGFETTMDQMVATFANALSIHVEQITTRFEEEIEKIGRETSEYKQITGKKLETTTQTVIQLIRELKSNLLEELTSSIGSYKEQIHATGEELGENIGALMTEIEEETVSIREQFNLTGKTLNEHQTTQVNNLSNTIGEECEKFVSKMTETTSKLGESSSTTLEDTVSLYEEESTKVHQSFTEAVQTQNEALNTMVATAKTDVKKNINQMQKEVKNRLDGYVGNTTQLIDGHMTTHDSIITETKDKGLTGAQTLTEEVSSLINKIVAKLETLVSDEIETNKAVIQDLEAKTQTTITETIDTAKIQGSDANAQVVKQKEAHLKGITNWTNDFTAKIQTVTDTTRETLQQELEGVAQSLNEKLTTLQEVLGKKIDEGFAATDPLGTRLNKNTAQELTTMRTTADKVITDITKGIKATTGPTRTLAEQTKKKLLTIWEETKQMKPRELETTWLVVNLENIKLFLAAMIKRCKSTITMAIPNKLDVPTDVIKKIPTSRRVHIITEINPDREDSDKTWVQDLYSKPNVRVLRHKKLKYIAATRDGEEVLLAPLQDLPDIAGLASEQEGYVKLYQQIIGPLFMADSREVRRREVDM